ncbi:hypothetical protein POM88_031001 [Heracleum sosnowskyi]|uniref:Uncharacterized protein n=1 Tax=Heracleum sosnowskyi TaxID=360622 RepID=A0AAD8MJW5_9APIA|nr:hypothetical protein POM88_031001 [Heracleum sosnowskyi]
MTNKKTGNSYVIFGVHNILRKEQKRIAKIRPKESGHLKTVQQIETWRLQHFDEKNGWSGPDLEDLYDDMMTLRENFTPEEKSDKQIMERVLGRHSVYLRGWGRCAGTTDNSGHPVTEPNQPSYQELLQKFNDTNTRLNEVANILRQNNLMPQTSPTNEASDTNSDS